MPTRAGKAKARRANLNAPHIKANYAQGALSSVCAKTKLCTFYRQGRCPHDRFCKFAHGEHELQPALDLSRTKMCPALVRCGECKRRFSCTYAHSDAELRPVIEAVQEPAIATALQEVWQQKADRWSEFSTSDSDGAESEASSLGREISQVTLTFDDFGDAPTSRAGHLTQSTATAAAEVLIVDKSFIDIAGQWSEGTRVFHRPTGTPLAIRNTFFDIDDGPARAGAARRCLSASARLGAPQPAV